MGKIWIAIDGGGTKTEFCACNEAGKVIFSDVFGNANYKASSYEDVLMNMRDGINCLYSRTGTSTQNVAGVVAGVAGCDSETDRAVYLQIICELGFSPKQAYICNDTELIFRALSDGNGICAVAGTGSIACAYDSDSMTARVGGWGAPASDLGSGYWIGAQIIQQMIMWLDGELSEKHDIYEDIRARFEREDEPLQCTLVSLSVSETASVAELVFNHAEKGDSLCCRIVRDSEEYLSGIIAAAYRKSGFSEDICIVTTGGMFSNDRYFENVKRGVQEKTGVKFIFLRPEASPAEDGLRFARGKFNSVI